MKIKGYEITTIRKDFLKVDLSSTSRTANIWEKRKCFICKRQFKDKELVTAVFTKIGKNLLACKNCLIKLEIK
jgi:phosphoribosyl-dephospho-CoA transferase